MRRIHQYVANRNVFRDCLKPVTANNRIPQAVWQGIPDQRASHRESPSAIKAESVARYDQELSGGGSEILPWCDTCDWLAQFNEVCRRLTVQAVEHHDAELVHDLLRNIQPMELGMEESRQASVELVGTADHTGCGVQHSLQFVGRRLRRTRQDSVAVVNARRDERMYECGHRFRNLLTICMSSIV